MEGVVADGLDPCVVLTVLDRNGQPVEVTATIDTGSTAPLTLPTAAIRELQLPWIATEDVSLADGSVVPCNVYEAQVTWLGEVRRIHVFETESNPLLGMTLMQGCRLTREIVTDGRIQLEMLPRRL